MGKSHSAAFPSPPGPASSLLLAKTHPRQARPPGHAQEVNPAHVWGRELRSNTNIQVKKKKNGVAIYLGYFLYRYTVVDTELSLASSLNYC